MQAFHGRIEGGIAASGNRQFRPQRPPGLRLALQRTQRVQALDVATALPDRVERRLAIQARQQRFLHVPVAAQAFLRFIDHRDRALADPELADRGRDPRERRFLPIRSRPIDRARHADRKGGGGLGVKRQIGQHGAHQWLVDEALAESATMAAMMQGLRQGHAHQPGRAEHAVQAREHHHFQDRGDAPTLLAHALRPCAVEFHFARGIAPVAELVLQAQ